MLAREQHRGNSNDLDIYGTGNAQGGLANGDGGNGLVVIYTGAANIAAVSPQSGSTAGGTVVTIYGLGFVSGTTVTIGGSICSNLNVVSVNQLTCHTPATGSSGSANVVLNAPGAQQATLVNGFKYL